MADKYRFQPFDPKEIRKMQRISVGIVAFITLMIVLAFAGCAEKEVIPNACDFANGEWTARDNEQIYLRFTDGELLSGSYWGDEIHIYDRYRYNCECETLFLTNTSTGYAHWLTFWNIGDSIAVVNGEFYGAVVYLKKI